MIPRLVTSRGDDDDRWACSGCGAKHRLEVIRTEHDEDGYPIRIRRCRNCKTVFATEETPIPLASFYGRANSRHIREARNVRSKFLTCKRCLAAYPPLFRPGTPAHDRQDRCRYRYGSFSAHVKTPYHQATLKHQVSDRERSRAAFRSRRTYWRNRGIDIETATMGHALDGLDNDPERIVTRIEDVPA